MTQKESIEAALTERDAKLEVFGDLKIVTFTKDVRDFGRPHLKMWRGKQTKAFLYTYYTLDARRDCAIAEEKEREQKRIDFRAKLAAEKAGMKNELSLGSILVYTWGWEQTNVNFYQVVQVTGKSVGIREINSLETSDGAQSMTGKAEGLKDAFIGLTIINKRVLPDGKSVKMEYGNATLWDGAPVRYSSYA